MKLYGTPPTRATRPIWLLNELEIDCEIIPLDIPAGELQGASFLAINPFGKVPALVDGDLAMAESVAIMMYLAEAHGGERFLPTNPAERALMHQWNLFLVTEIEQPLWRMGLHTVIYPEAERIPEEIPLARRDCLRMLAPLEAHLEGRDHMVGSGLTVADFNAAYTLDWADEDGGLLEGFPNCRRFVERMYARRKAPPRIAEAFARLHSGEVPPCFRADIAPEQRLLPCI